MRNERRHFGLFQKKLRIQRGPNQSGVLIVKTRRSLRYSFRIEYSAYPILLNHGTEIRKDEGTAFLFLSVIFCCCHLLLYIL